MRESEDHVEFKKGEYGNVSYNGGGKERPKDRVVAELAKGHGLTAGRCVEESVSSPL